MPKAKFQMSNQIQNPNTKMVFGYMFSAFSNLDCIWYLFPIPELPRYVGDRNGLNRELNLLL